MPNHDALIAQLRKQKEEHQQAIRQIDQVISGLQTLPIILQGAAARQAETPEPDDSDSDAQQEGAYGFPFTVRTEVEAAVNEIHGNITQPAIFKIIMSKYPGNEQRAKEVQLGARISGELSKLVKKGVLVLAKESFSNFPAQYRKAN